MAVGRATRISLEVAGAAIAVVLVGRCSERFLSTTATSSIPLRQPTASSALRSSGAAATSPPLPVKFFDGGYAVGPAREIEKVIAAHVRGTRTGCEEPPPTPEERATWKPFRTELSSVPLTDLLKRSDLDLVTEVGSRLLDKTYGPGFPAMSRPEQNVFLVWALEGEVNNGGLDQFFSNSSGNCALRTATALDEIGMVEESKIYKEALALFPDAAPSEDRSTRFDQLEALGGRRSRWNSMGRELESALLGTAG